VAPALEAGPILDVGAGNGSPGLVLAALRPDLPVTLLEPRRRRWAFLREAARAMGRGSVDVRRERHADYAGPAARTLTLRALRLPGPELVPLVVPGGRILVFGGRLAALGPLRPDPSAGSLPGISAYRRPPCST
jgi:16S rRNA (guanine527-N7)-methyltransferase